MSRWLPPGLAARYGNGTPAWQEHATARWSWYHMRSCERALARPSTSGTVFEANWQSVNQDRKVLGLPSLEDVMAAKLLSYRDSGQAYRDGWADWHGDGTQSAPEAG